MSSSSDKLPAVPRKGFVSANCETIYTICLSLFTKSADLNHLSLMFYSTFMMINVTFTLTISVEVFWPQYCFVYTYYRIIILYSIYCWHFYTRRPRSPSYFIYRDQYLVGIVFHSDLCTEQLLYLCFISQLR